MRREHLRLRGDQDDGEKTGIRNPPLHEGCGAYAARIGCSTASGEQSPADSKALHEARDGRLVVVSLP
jgi:hypothetical protein